MCFVDLTQVLKGIGYRMNNKETQIVWYEDDAIILSVKTQITYKDPCIKNTSKSLFQTHNRLQYRKNKEDVNWQSTIKALQ